MLFKVVILWRRLVQAFSSSSVLQLLSTQPSKGSEHIGDFDQEEDKNNETNLNSPAFSSENQVRIILFQECDRNGRKVLFDSKLLRRNKQDKTSISYTKRCGSSNSASSLGQEETKTDFQRKTSDEHLKPHLDIRLLEEMIFGTVAMTYSGTTVKIHTLRSPPQLVISVVFPAPPPNEDKSREKELEESGSWHHHSNEVQISKCADKISSVAHSVPVDVPGCLSTSNHRNYNKYILSDSLHSTGSTGSLRSLSHLSPDSVSSSLNCSGSYNSLQRRWLRNMTTSIEFGLNCKDDESSSVEEVKETNHRKVKLGLSVVITLDENNPKDLSQFQEFFFSHITIIESHVFRLKNTICKAYLNKKNSVTITCEGIEKFCRSLQDLYTAPRLQCPVWLMKMLPETDQNLLYSRFLKQFVSLIDKYERKETNFFISTLLTAILTHHLAWVPTVTPSSALVEEIGAQKNIAQWLEMLAKSHPYNPLWMQLGDMYGCLGFPNKLARTIVSGKKNEAVDELLFVLSYFIRCSGIVEQVFEKSVVTEDNLTPLAGIYFCLPKEGVTETPVGMDCENRLQTFPSNYFPKRRYSLQQDILKWTQNVHKDFNFSINDQCNCNILSKKINWKKLGGEKQEFPDDMDNVITYTATNGFCKFDTILPTNTEESVFLLDENLPLTNCEISNISKKEYIETSNDLNTSESVAGSLGYNSINDQLDTKELITPIPFKQAWDHVSNSSNTNGTTVENTRQKCEMNSVQQSNDKTSLDTDFNPSNTSNSNNSRQHRLCLCRTNSLDFDYSTTRKCQRITNVTKCKHNQEGINEDKWCQCKLNSTCKNLSDDGPEEGYHSMEETKMVVTKSVNNLALSSDANILQKVSELQLPKFQVKEVKTDPSLHRGYGWSLLSGTSNHYMTDFCLQGIKGCVKEEEIREDLLAAVEVPVLGEPILEAIGIIADTDNWTVKLISSNRESGDCEGSCSVHVGMSALVADICESVLQMNKLNMPPELCMMHIEDRLQELYFRSRMLAEYLCSESCNINLNKAITALNLNPSDITLLTAVAATHTPQLAAFNR